MKFFQLKSYYISKIKKWIPSADIFIISTGSVKVIDEYSIREEECCTKEEADIYITEICVKEGMQKLNGESKSD